MAQGMKKTGAGGGGKAVAKSKGSQKHKASKAKVVIAKGRRQKKPKHHDEASRIQQETTKAINKKNERLIAAKAVSVGTKFFLSDVAEKGANHVKKEAAVRDKKQLKSKTTSRIEKQIQKLQT